jgi:hypothetical protein
MAAINSAPTFNRDSVKGWYTRLIFSQTMMETIDISSSNYFNVVSAANCKGSGVLPANYWSEGRILRIKGTFLYSSVAPVKLNIRTGIDDGTNQTYADQDNGLDHDFANGEAHDNVPVNFEINIIYSNSNYFTVEGHYQYEYGSYVAGGPNIDVVHVPITPQSGNVVDVTSTTNIHLVIGTETVNMIYLTIEELG